MTEQQKHRLATTFIGSGFIVATLAFTVLFGSGAVGIAAAYVVMLWLNCLMTWSVFGTDSQPDRGEAAREAVEKMPCP